MVYDKWQRWWQESDRFEGQNNERRWGWWNWSQEGVVEREQWVFEGISSFFLHSWALPLHASFAAFFVFVFWDPHLLKGPKWCENGSADPGGKSPFRRLIREQEFQSHTRRQLLTQVVIQTIRESWKSWRIKIDLWIEKLFFRKSRRLNILTLMEF